MRLFLALLLAMFWGSGSIASTPPPRAHYTINVDVDAAGRRLSAQSRLRIPAAAAARGRVEFRLRTDMGIPQVRALGASRAQGALSLSKTGEDGANSIWRVVPARPFPANRPIELEIRQSGGSSVSLLFYIGPEIVFVGGGTTAWYPQFGDGRGMGTLTLNLPQGFTAVATAPAARVRGRGTTFEAAWPTHFGFTAGPYVVREERSGNRRIRLLLLKERDFGPELAALAARSIQILEREFGPYPFGDFAIAEIPSGPGSRSGFLGAAFDGYMLIREDLLTARRADPQFFGHEIGHQWWGVSLQNPTDDGEYMLDEALAHYGSLVVVEELLGAEAGARHRRGVGHLDGVTDAALLVAAEVDRPLAQLPVAFGYYELSHYKGGLVYQLLARRIGRERFRAMLHRITAQHAYGTVTWPSMRAALAAELGADGERLLAQWLDRPGLPVVSHAWLYADGEAVITIEQTGTPYELDLPIRLTFADGAAEMRNLPISEARHEIRVPARSEVIGVEIDPNSTLPWITPAEAAAATDAAFATRARVLWDEGKLDEAIAELRRGLAARGETVAGPGAFMERLYLGWIEHDAGRPAEALALFQEALRLPVRPEAELPQLYWRINRAAIATGDTALARWAATALLSLPGASANLARQARAYLEAPAQAPAARPAN
ncbi:MAG TPA: hypothetical protein VGB54_09025 [Allosphingosinicella sp.]|jgi:aminopeptidase N